MKTYDNGFSLAEVLVAAGLVGGLSLAILNMTSTGLKSAKTIESKTEVTSLIEEIRQVLSNPDACRESFQGINASNSGSNVTEIRDASGTGRYIEGSKRGSVSVDSFVLSDSVHEVEVIPNSIGSTFLNVSFSRGKGTYGSGDNRKIKLSVTTNAASEIISCVAVSGSASNLWSRSASNSDNIFYNGGHAGIANTDPQFSLDLVGGIRAVNSLSSNSIGFNLNSSTETTLEFKNSSDNEVAKIFFNDSSTDLNIQTAGNLLLSHNSPSSYVGIGTSSPSEKLHIVGSVVADTYRGNSFQYTSDARLKKNIKNYQKRISDFNELRPVSYNWKRSGKEDIGLIAQEVELVFPHLVDEDNKGIKRVDYAKLVPILIMAIKYQEERIQKLEKGTDYEND